MSATSKARPRLRAKASAAAKRPDILQALGDEHKYQTRLLNVLEKQVGKLNQRQQPDYEQMRGVMRYMTQYPDRFHHPKEDLLFDKLVKSDPTTRAQVDALLRAHREIAASGTKLLALIERDRADPAAADPNALRKTAHAYIGALRRHMDIEWLHLFPRAEQVLEPEDWADVDRRMKPILDPVFGSAVAGGEFDALREAEAATPEPSEPGRLGSGLIEAAALIEAVTALIAGMSRMRRDWSEHRRETSRINRELLDQWLDMLPLPERFSLLGEVLQRNLTMLSEINNRMGESWSQTWAMAMRPYEEGEGPYAPRLLRRRRRRGVARAASPHAKARGGH